MKQKILIKKYRNRRLYDMDQKRYITLEELTERIQDGYEVQIIDSKTNEDITQVVLIQVILESQKTTANCLFTNEVLHQLIQYRDQSVAEFFQDYLPNILRSYIDWQQEAQSQFMRWAQLGWSANQYSREMFMPGLNMLGMGQRLPRETAPEGKSTAASNGTSSEIETLKNKVDELESRLNKTRKKG